MRRKKTMQLISLVITLLFSIIIVNKSVSATPIAVLSVPTVQDTSLVFGSEFSVNITVANVEELWGFQFVLTYDPNILMAMSYSSYDPFNQTLPSEIGWGYVAVAYSVEMGEPDRLTTVNPVPIAKIDFVVLDYGSSILDLSNSILTRTTPEGGEEIPHSVVDGFFANIPLPSGTVYIRSDGSVDPSTAPISTIDNITYTLTGDIVFGSNNGIVVEKDNVVVDGAGYTLQGTRAWDSKGIHLTGRSNVTIENTKIKEFYTGIKLYESTNNSMYGNNILMNHRGIVLGLSSNNTISGNNITANDDDGIHLGTCSKNSISRNSIANNFYGIARARMCMSSNNSVSENSITANNYLGIWVEGSSPNNSI